MEGGTAQVGGVGAAERQWTQLHEVAIGIRMAGLDLRGVEHRGLGGVRVRRKRRFGNLGERAVVVVQVLLVSAVRRGRTGAGLQDQHTPAGPGHSARDQRAGQAAADHYQVVGALRGL
ncbi:hypothetical protein D3C81_832850 [compost metagenome]